MASLFFGHYTVQSAFAPSHKSKNLLAVFNNIQRVSHKGHFLANENPKLWKKYNSCISGSDA